MESNHKSVVIIIMGMLVFLFLVVLFSAVKEIRISSDMVNAGLQQCVVEINGYDTVIWKKECGG